MTKLLYRGQPYTPSAMLQCSGTQLRYDPGVFAKRQQGVPTPHQLTYRGIAYLSGQSPITLLSGDFCYRGVVYSR